MHPYAEVFVLQGGQALFVVGNEQQRVIGGQIVVVAPHTPHQFTNVGQEALKLIAIHPSAHIEQIWLEPHAVQPI